MRAIGIVRKLDQLGRVVVPIETRRTHGIAVGDPMEIFTDGDQIILQKFTPPCTFCGSKTEVSEYKGKNMCSTCRAELVQMV